MNKDQMAHDYAMECLRRGAAFTHAELAELAFDYVEAMQAESKKRQGGVLEAIADARSFTHDKDGNCLHFHHEFGHKKCMGCGASLEEWQPDWSQAPDDRIDHWSKESDGTATWWIGEPILNIRVGAHHDSDTSACFDDAPDFGYTGDWRNSLRKRPEMEVEQNG